MKKVTQPQLHEEAVYYSDFTGHCFGVLAPAVEVKVQFNYGSKYDGESFELHLTDEEAGKFIEFIKGNTTKEFQDTLKFL